MSGALTLCSVHSTFSEGFIITLCSGNSAQVWYKLW